MSAASDEEKVRRVLALLEKEFGPVEGARPKLRLVRNLESVSGDAKNIGATNASEKEARLCQPKPALRPKLVLLQGGRVR